MFIMKKIIIPACFLLCVACNGFGAETNRVEVTNQVEIARAEKAFSNVIDKGSEARSVIRSVLSVVLVLGALIGVNWYLRRRAPLIRAKSGRKIQLLERLALDPRRSLLLVEAKGRTILLAVSQQQITALSEWNEGEGEKREDVV